MTGRQPGHSSAEALVLVERTALDLIVTDHHLLDLPGAEFARLAAVARPGTPVLLVSEAVMPERLLAVEGSVTAFLLQAFGVEDLERAAHETLDTVATRRLDTGMSS